MVEAETVRDGRRGRSPARRRGQGPRWPASGSSRAPPARLQSGRPPITTSTAPIDDPNHGEDHVEERGSAECSEEAKLESGARADPDRGGSGWCRIVVVMARRYRPGWAGAAIAARVRPRGRCRVPDVNSSGRPRGSQPARARRLASARCPQRGSLRQARVDSMLRECRPASSRPGCATGSWPRVSGLVGLRAASARRDTSQTVQCQTLRIRTHFTRWSASLRRIAVARPRVGRMLRARFGPLMVSHRCRPGGPPARGSARRTG